MAKYDYIRKTFTFCGRRYTVYGKTEAEAAEKMGALKAQLDRDDVILDKNTTVSRWVKEWMETYIEPRDLGASQLSTYRNKSEYVCAHLGRMKLKDVREPHLQKILNSRQGNSFSDLSKLRQVIKSIFSRAAAARLISFDPSLHLSLPSCTQGKRRSMTDTERAAFLSVAAQHPAGPLFLTLLYTGIRPGEAIALQWKDIDFRSATLHVTKALEAWEDGVGSIKSPKTDAGVRDIPIPDVLLPVLAARRGDPFDFAFPQHRDRRAMMTHTCLKRYWESFTRAMDIQLGAVVERVKINGSRKHSTVIIEHALADDFCMYCLRHTYCTDLQRAGVPLNVAKYLMGHSDIKVTANIYTDTTADVVEDARAKINSRALM